MDTQVTEILGRNWLVSQLLLGGLEVAEPLRDRGIDLVVYADRSDKVSQFSALPIQMKSYSKIGFAIEKKYQKFPDLMIVYVWNVGTPGSEIAYALNYNQAIQLCDEMKYAKTDSWTINGRYAFTRKLPGKNLSRLLDPYEMNPKKWFEIVTYKTQAKSCI